MSANITNIIVYLLRVLVILVCLVIDADYTGFTISAYDGTPTDNCPGGLLSTMVFNCSETANWTSIDISKYTQAYPDVDTCEVCDECDVCVV